MARRKKKRDITFYLLKVGNRSIEDDLSGEEDVQVTRLSGKSDLDVVLVTRPARDNEPWWVAFLRDGFGDIERMMNSNTAALLFVTVDGRRFALTFGYGRNLLALDSIERNFGLKVVLNTIDPKTLRSVDARTFEDISIAKRIQTSQAAGLESFNLRETEEILRAVTGKPSDTSLGARITGADAVKVTYVPDFSDLAQKCKSLLAAYERDTYKQEFGFIDYLGEVRDSIKIQELNRQLIERLRKREVEGIHLAPPDVADWSDVDEFAYSFARRQTFNSLEIDDYLKLLESRDISLEMLKRHKIGVIYSASSDPLDKWAIYEAIVCELRSANDLYILSGGTWYRIEPTFAQQLAADLKQYAIENRILPTSNLAEREDIYNLRASGERGYFLFDKKEVRPDRAKSDIELCDLMTADKKFIHIKRKSRSSTLSHLFAQGAVAAELFWEDQIFRERIRIKAEQEISADAALNIPKDRPDPRDWEIVYGIILKTNGPWPTCLPFFSQLNFRNVARRLNRIGYKVSLVRIDAV